MSAGHADRVVLGQSLAGIGQQFTRANPLGTTLARLVERDAALQLHFAAFPLGCQRLRATGLRLMEADE